MDPATAIGLGLAFLVIIVANLIDGGNPLHLLLLSPMLLVFGTTLAICVAGGTMADAKQAIASLKHALTAKVEPPLQLVPTVVSLAESARREGLLALESKASELEDPFLVKGITLAVDGTDPEEVRDILEGELFAKKMADKQSAKFYADAGAYAPTIGIIGTVMHLVEVLGNLSSPDKLGPMIAAAFVATLWGVTSANVIFLPLASRLKRLSELECVRMEMAITGIWAIQAGSNPRIVAQKLRSHVLDVGDQQAA